MRTEFRSNFNSVSFLKWKLENFGWKSNELRHGWYDRFNCRHILIVNFLSVTVVWVRDPRCSTNSRLMVSWLVAYTSFGSFVIVWNLKKERKLWLFRNSTSVFRVRLHIFVLTTKKNYSYKKIIFIISYKSSINYFCYYFMHKKNIFIINAVFLYSLHCINLTWLVKFSWGKCYSQISQGVRNLRT